MIYSENRYVLSNKHHQCYPSTDAITRRLQPLFGLTEIGSLYIRNPINPGLQAAVSEHNVVFMHATLYTMGESFGGKGNPQR